MQKNIKIIIALVVCCLIYMLLIFFIKGNTTDGGYLINSELGGFYCQNGICEWQSSEDIVTDNKYYALYQENELVDTYTASYETSWNFYKNKEWQGVYGDFIAVDNSLDYEVLDYRLEKFTEEDIANIKKTIAKYGITSYEDLNKSRALVLDLDENGEEDRIIAVSNQTEEETSSHYFSLLIINLNGKLKEIYVETEENATSFHLPYYSVASVLKIDNKVKMIVNKGYFNNVGSSSTIMLNVSKNKIKEETKTNENSF
jgi:hypothetical protein